MKILVVDDEDLLVKGIRFNLQNEGYEVITGSNGLEAVTQAQTQSPDLIILDPPRDGIHPKALPKIIGYGVDRIVYISCKPTSLVRDLECFLQKGYRVVKAVAVDQFPWTANCEVVCLLSKCKKNTKKNIEYREEEVADCACIYG